MNAASGGRLTRPRPAGPRFRFVEVFAAASTSTRRFSRASQQGSERHVVQVQCLPLCSKHLIRVGGKKARVRHAAGRRMLIRAGWGNVDDDDDDDR